MAIETEKPSGMFLLEFNIVICEPQLVSLINFKPYVVLAPPGFLNIGGQHAPQSYAPLDNGHHHHGPPLTHAPSSTPTHTIIHVNNQPAQSVVYMGGGCPSCRVCYVCNIFRMPLFS